MKERIRILAEKTLRGEMWVDPVPTKYDREDLFLSPVMMSAKRVSEYILNQEPLILPEHSLAGLLKFDGSVEGDFFQRGGHRNMQTALKYFYNQPLHNLLTFEWQHSVGDFPKVLKEGLQGLLLEIDESEKKHTGADELEFLGAERQVLKAIIGWVNKCGQKAAKIAETTDVPEYRENLLKLSRTLEYIPEKPASDFYEAVLSVYVCYPFIPDSIGTVDRYLYPYYVKDINEGKLTKEDAAAYLQELFLMLQARISIESDRFYRGGESHFCVGGYLKDGSDGFTELSRLVIDSLLELPTFIPQISLRWTSKTHYEDFLYVLNRAIHDPNMRIAFVNDEPRLKGFQEILGMKFEDAVDYTMVGCNEPALTGGMIMGSAQENIARFIENVFYNRREDVLNAQDFDTFYEIAAEEMRKDLAEMLYYDKAMNLLRARDVNLVSSPFFRGCIENAKSMTQGGCSFTSALLDLIGFTTAVDSIAVTKQFVYDEKRCTMAKLCEALDADWEGFEDLHTLIQNKGRFYGNNDELSDGIAVQLYETMYDYLKDKTDWCGKHYMVGDLIGYNEHNVWFGEAMRATPDGRHKGERISFGRGQSDSRDKNGITALLNSVSDCDPHHLVCGPTVTNLMLDKQMIKDDESIGKLSRILETYFLNGGMHFQLSYTDRETLVCAQERPAEYRTLRVRVSGFSDFFNNLNTNLQNEIIDRTQING